MLPGLRFLFVAIVLSTSMLIFGLGAAALLRSAHEEFASLPNKRPQPEPVFAQPAEASRPTLAMLRVDTPPTEQSDTDAQGAPMTAAPLPEPPSPVGSTTAEPVKAAEPDKTTTGPDQGATLNIAAPSEEKSGATEKPAELSAALPAQADIAARADIGVARETPATANPEPTQPAVVDAPAAVPEPASPPADDGAKAAALKIATLGGPEVTVDPKAASKPPVATAAKRAQNRQRVKRRRIVRPRPVPPQPMTLGLFEPLQTATRQTRQN